MILKSIKEIMEEMNKNTLFEELKSKELEHLKELDKVKFRKDKEEDEDKEPVCKNNNEWLNKWNI